MRMPRKQTDFDSPKLQWHKVKSLKRSWLAGSPHVATHEEDMFEVSVHQYSWVECNPATPSPTLPPPAASCVQSCFKIYIIWVWSAFQMAFPVVTLSGNKGETHLLISLSLCVGVYVCVWQEQANRARLLKRETYCRKETGDWIKESEEEKNESVSEIEKMRGEGAWFRLWLIKVKPAGMVSVGQPQQKTWFRGEDFQKLYAYANHWKHTRSCITILEIMFWCFSLIESWHPLVLSLIFAFNHHCFKQVCCLLSFPMPNWRPFFFISITTSDTYWPWLKLSRPKVW